MTEKNGWADLLFIDYAGFVRTKTVRGKDIEDKVSFDGSSIALGVDISRSDMYLIPNKESCIEFNGRKKYICEIDSELSPRRFLKSTLSKFEKQYGLTFKTGIEPEFYLLKDGKKLDAGTYLADYEQDFTDTFFDLMDKCNLKPMMCHHEVGQGQYEFGFEGDDPIKTGDNLAFFKTIVRHAATMHGYEATFMPKPFIDDAGNGMHVHISLWEGDKNVFEEDEGRLKQFIAGLLENAEEITAVTNPSINSYKRLGSHEAPVYIAWGHENRSALVRIPRAGNRIEYRSPDCSANPYLVFALMVEAGMEGIEGEFVLEDELKESAYTLPKEKAPERLPWDLRNAIDKMKAEDSIAHMMPKEMFDAYLQVKYKEINNFRNQVTEKEKEMYWFV